MQEDNSKSRRVNSLKPKHRSEHIYAWGGSGHGLLYKIYSNFYLNIKIDLKYIICGEIYVERKARPMLTLNTRDSSQDSTNRVVQFLA